MEVEEPQRNKLCRAYRAQTNCRSNHGQNRRRVFRLPRRSAKSESVARFADLNLSRHKPSPGKIQGRGPQPPSLVVLRGLQRGKAPTRIQRSDSCGKRRNNGTDDACPPQAADRMRDVEFVPTQLLLCRFLFTASGLFFPIFSAKTEKIWPPEAACTFGANFTVR